MSNSNIEIGLGYEDLVLRRPEPLVPRERRIDWGDQPSHFKLYRDVPRLPLASRAPVGLLRSLKQLMTEPGPEQSGQKPLSYDDISNLLLLTNGLLKRRMDVNWNPEAASMHRHEGTTYARPAASGGGRYPCELYLLAGDECSGIRAGVYHYDGAHHALERLQRGDATARVRAAALDHPATQTDCFILVSINFWKNHFKYHNFSYHVVTQDLGAMLGTLHQTAKGMGIHSTVLHWFNDEMLNRTLGLETQTESVFAVVALGPAATNEADNGTESRRQDGEPSWMDSMQPGHRTYQRSRRTFRLPLVEQTHQSTLITEEPRPLPTEISRARCEALTEVGEPIRLAAPNLELLNKGLQQVLLERKSSSGRMLKERPLEQEQLSTLLRAVTYGQDYNSDVKASVPTDSCTRLMLLVNHVQEIPSGIYNYEASHDALREVQRGEFFTELQEKYFLQNYNLEQPAVVIAIVGSFARSLEVFGNRGIRILNAEAGVIAQQVYLAAASLGLGCGAILGFKNVEVNQLYGLADSDQTALLLLLVGSERSIQGSFDYSLL